MELKGYITNLADYNNGILNGEWLTFPADEEDIEAALKRIGCADGTEYFFTDWESDILEASDLGEYIAIDEVNDMFERLERWDPDTLAAVVDAYGKNEAYDSYPEDFILIPDVHDDNDLGCYYAIECGVLNEIPERLQYYFDFEAYGRDIRFETDGAHTPYGWIECVR